MNIKYLQSFIAVCRSGSIAAAARQLNLTPAAVAARIKTLEEEIGIALIKRAGRYTRPTQAGVRILQHAESLVRDTRDIVAMAHNSEQVGELRLGVATSTLAELTPTLLGRLYESMPELRVHVVSGASSQLYNWVVARELDAAIMVEPVEALPKGFTWNLIRSEPLVLIASSRVRLCPPNELLAIEPFLRFDRNLRGGQLAETYLRHNRITPQERLEIDMLPTIAQLVAAGYGVSLIPDWSPQWLSSMRLLKLSLPDTALARNMGLFWEETGSKRALLRTVLRMVS